MKKILPLLSAFVVFMSALIILFTPLRPQLSFVTPELKLIGTPTPTPSIDPVIMTIFYRIASPSTLSGKIDRSWVFEGSFPVSLYDDNNKLLFQGTGLAPNWTVGTDKYTDFKIDLKFTSATDSGYLLVKNDNPSGLPENTKSIKIPVSLKSDPNLMNIKLYFDNPKLDPENTNCAANDFITASIPKTTTPLKASIDKLISQLFTKDLNNKSPKNFKLNSAVIKNGVATLNFSDPDYYSTGGSCWSGIITDMITKTAMQFPTVKSVKFSGPDYLFQP